MSNSIIRASLVKWAFLILCIVNTIVYTAGNNDPTNPLKGSITIHDPSSIQKDGDYYYTFGSHGTGLSSKDRITWNTVSSPIKALGTMPWWKEHGGDIWAPECVLMDNVYYFFYSVSAWMDFNSAIGVATGTKLTPNDPEYTWVDQGVVIDSLQAANGGPMVNVIDPGTFLDDDGKWFLIFGSFQGGIRLIELNRASGKPVHNPPKPVIITDHLGEASFLLHWKNYYYCTVSTGKCCKGMESTYQIVYGRSTSVNGPYTSREGKSFKNGYYTVLLSRDYSSNGSVLHAGMGCSGFFWDHDTLFMSYHAYTAPTGDALLNIKPVYLDSEDWLTMDPKKGKVITREKTGIYSKNSIITPGKNCSPVITRKFISKNQPIKSGDVFYSITGKRYNGTISNYLPTGVYIKSKKTGPEAYN